ncbi:MAG: tetratricopeptide repeat protein [Treponema sp.]|jgi:Ca-activated chloride channel family protein|nr:tetratricopeptide repeat protein [Treponema sp.]
MSFDYPWVLSGFAVFIPLILIDICAPRKKRERNYLPRNLRRRLSASNIFFRVFLACVIIALASPRWGSEQAGGAYRRGLDAVIAVDLSRSMDIEDALPFEEGREQLSRLERGLAIVREIVAAVPGARFAAVVGRSRGLTAVPLTWDNGTVLSFLEALNGSSLTGRGTNLESLINAAVGAFQNSFPSRRVILLVSDGESLSGSVKAALDRCGRDEIIVTSLALGSDEGRPVPGQEDAISRRDAALMRMAAERTGGIYVDGGAQDAAAVLAAHLRSLAPGAEIRGNRGERKARWYLFIAAAILAYGMSKLCLLRIKQAGLILLLPALLCFSSCSRLPGKLLVMEANFFNVRGSYTEAVSSYSKALAYEEAAPYAEYGLGLVYYSLDEGTAALERFADSRKILDALPPGEHRELRYRLSYNTGEALFGTGDFAGAAASFREALRLEPARIEAKRNLELSLLSLANESSRGGRSERGEQRESYAALFEYLRQKEYGQWKSREWAAEEETEGPDY